MYKVIVSLLFGVLLPAFSVAQTIGTKSFTALYTHATDCPGNTLTALPGQECLTTSTGVRKICLTPAAAGGASALFCDQASEWGPSGGSPPGGTAGQVQWNNAGAFGGITGATSNGTALTLTSPVLQGPGAATPGTLGFFVNENRVVVGEGSLSRFLHPVLSASTDCTTSSLTRTAVIGETCVDQDDGHLWMCKNPAAGPGPSSTLCDVPADWLDLWAPLQQADPDLTSFAAIAPTDDAIAMGNGTIWQGKTIPDCSNGTTGKLLYSAATNTWSCGTDQAGGGGTGTGDFSTNTASASANEIVLFADGSGKLGKRATGTGIARINGGQLAVASAGTDYTLPSALSTPGTINTGTNPVDWTQLKNVPTGFADGTDDGGGGSLYCADTSNGTPGQDAYACNMSPAVTSYTTGAVYTFKANSQNLGAATLNLNTAGPKTIVKRTAAGVTTTLRDGDIRAGGVYQVVYDGTNMQLIGDPVNLQTAYDNDAAVPGVAFGGQGLTFMNANSVANAFRLCNNTACTNYMRTYYDSATTSWITDSLPLSDYVTKLSSGKSEIVEQNSGADIWKITEAGVISAEAAGTVNFASAAKTTPMQVGTTDPASCTPGQMFFNTSNAAGSKLRICNTANSWGAAGLMAVDYSKFIKREKPEDLCGGCTYVYSLKHEPITGSEEVFVNGLLQEEGEAYWLIHKILVFSSGPPADARIRVSYIAE